MLDIIVIPEQKEQAKTKLCFRAAVVSNSALVQIVDQDFRSEPLVGHTDVVLSVDVSPDGYGIRNLFMIASPHLYISFFIDENNCL